jgi:soluble lytic murein transglycosylase-like protein
MSQRSRRLSAVTAAAASAVILSLIGGTPALAATPQHVQAPTLAPAQLSWGAYTVRPGDTLGAIAARHHMSLSAIFTANRMNARTIIYPGQKIRVTMTMLAAPAPMAVVKAPAKAAPVHIVKSGDTLGRIASQHRVSLNTILAVNRMTLRTIIYPGQRILLSGTAAARPTPAATAPARTTVKAPAARTTSYSTAQIKSMVAATARRMGVDPSLALAFAQQESGFRQNVTSSAGAIGTMQIMPSSGTWASQLTGRKLNLRNAQDNITAGVAIIRSLVRTSPSLRIAIASYYQGQYSVMHRGMYQDTKAYVASVLRHQQSFR